MKTGYFEESPGVKSSTRLNSFLLLIFFIEINNLWMIKYDTIPLFLVILDAIILVGVFTPKYIHKLAEIAMTLKGGKLTPSDKPPK